MPLAIDVLLRSSSSEYLKYWLLIKSDLSDEIVKSRSFTIKKKRSDSDNCIEESATNNIRPRSEKNIVRNILRNAKILKI